MYTRSLQSSNKLQDVGTISLLLVRVRTRTNALCLGVVDSKPMVTRRALHGAMRRTICPCFPNAILACARSRYAIGQQTNAQSQQHGFIELLRGFQCQGTLLVYFKIKTDARAKTQPHTDALGSGVVHNKPMVAQCALHGAMLGTMCPCFPNAILACAAIH